MTGKAQPAARDRALLTPEALKARLQEIGATRYHSLIVDEHSLPPSLIADARTPEGELMSVRHRDRPVFGLQFHPESILTAHGHDLLRNFLNQEVSPR